MDVRLIGCLSILWLASDASAQRHALELGDGAKLEFPHNAVMHTGPTATIEAWVRAQRPSTGHGVFTRYAASAEHKTVHLQPDGSIHFLYAGSPWAHGLATAPGAFPFDSKWHHVAFSRQADGRYEIAVDGIVKHSGGPGPCWLTCNLIQTSTTTRSEANGTTLALARLRYSSVARYSGNFIPQHTWTVDAETRFLVDFAEGTGTAVHDSGPAKQIGTVAGTHRWVAFDPPPPASSSPFGQGCPGSLGPASLTVSKLPVIGKQFELRVDSAPKLLPALVYLGFSRTSWGQVPLPLDLTGLGLPKCSLLVSPDWGFHVSTGPETWFTFSLAVPGDVAFAGIEFFNQVWIFDKQANLFGAFGTNGLASTIGC